MTIKLAGVKAATFFSGYPAQVELYEKICSKVAEKYHGRVLSEEAVEKRFPATGADILVTACDRCQAALRKVLPDRDRKRIKQLTELVEERT